MLMAALIGAGFCKGIYDANIFASLFDVVRPEDRGTAAGLMNTVGWTGGLVGAPRDRARVGKIRTGRGDHGDGGSVFASGTSRPLRSPAGWQTHNDDVTRHTAIFKGPTHREFHGGQQRRPHLIRLCLGTQG